MIVSDVMMSVGMMMVTLGDSFRNEKAGYHSVMSHYEIAYVLKFSI